GRVWQPTANREESGTPSALRPAVVGRPRPHAGGGTMERLTGLDATFLALETPTSHMHVAGLAVFDPSTSEVPWSFEHVVEVYEQRLHLAPPFRRRLAPVPLGLHHPLWIEDPDFDLRNHVRHTAVPAPGGPD